MRWFPFLLHGLLAAIALLLVSCTQAEPRGPVVLAPASMLEAMETIADAWEAKGHARPVLGIAGTPAIARQAAEGAPADIVITADQEWMDWLDERGVIDQASRIPLVANGLALVRGAETDPSVTLRTPGSSLATGDPDTVPAGRYARTILAERMDWESYVIPTDSVRAALALVERGEADFAFIYTSDLRHHGNGLVVEETWSEIDGQQIIYPMAMSRHADHPEREQFYRFLQSEEVSGVFIENGFVRLEETR